MTRPAFLRAAAGVMAACALPGVASAAESPDALDTATGTISGTFSAPQGAGPFPTVLIIAGSGPTDRNGNSPMLPGRNDAYKLLAKALRDRGIASLRYDKRGIGESAAAMREEQDLRFDTYVEDAIGWVEQLRADKRCARITIAGHSEGSLIGMLAAQRSPVDAFVSLEGAGRPAAAVLREQLQNTLSPALFAQAEEILASLDAGKIFPNPPPELAALFRPSVQPYLISWFKYDPAQEIAKLRQPVTIVQGTADVQVTMTDARDLAAADPNAKLVIVNGMNHMLKYAPDTSSRIAILAGYANPALPVDPQVVSAVDDAALS